MTGETGGAPGSRARTRELGYADAWAEMTDMLSARREHWQRAAVRRIESAIDGGYDPCAGALPADVTAAVCLAGELRRLSEHAAGVCDLYADSLPPAHPRSLASLDMRLREAPPEQP